jgi:putative Mg2+ transporter-C (MgtC) family protein
MDSHLFDMSLRLVVAMVLGGIIGLERDYRAKDAGFRTHFLVAVGSALFTLLSMYGFAEGVRDTSRVAAQIVSGIGFLGAGLIVFQKNVVHGLTTAAGLWVTAAVGMACGTGQYYLAVFVTMLMLVGLELLGHLVPKLGGMTNVRLTFSSVSKETVSKALENIRNDVADVVSFEMKNRHSSHGDLYDVQIEVRMRRKQRRDSLLNYLHDFDDVTIFSEE